MSFSLWKPLFDLQTACVGACRLNYDLNKFIVQGETVLMIFTTTKYFFFIISLRQNIYISESLARVSLIVIFRYLWSYHQSALNFLWAGGYAYFIPMMEQF